MYDTEALEADATKLRKSGYFDAEWYAQSYPDVAMLHMDPAEHYLKYGAEMRRDPGPDFSTIFYSMTHRETLGKRVNPLLHHLEGKTPACAQPEYVLQATQAVARIQGYDRALTLAEMHLPDMQKHTIDLLHANRAVALGDDNTWLKRLNSYLSHFSLAPLRLSDRSGSLMERFDTEQISAVHDGPKVSVLMPAWNAQDSVGYSMRSILNQSWRNIELIIVDDASTDDTWNIIQQIAASDSRVTPLRNAINVGPYVTKNIAVTQARGDFITGHDADDWAHPQRIERQVSFSHERNLPAFLSSMLRMSPKGELVRFNPVGDMVYDGATRGAFISMMARAQYFHDLLGFWDAVRVAGDSEMIRRIEHLEQRNITMQFEPLMLCLDNPDGLTNHPTLGHSEVSGVSRIRQKYKKSFLEAHTKLKRTNSRMEFPLWDRPFPAPASIRASMGRLRTLIKDYEQRIELKRNVSADVIIATDLRFPGGNASSTLDEIATFLDAGFNVSVINCPVDNDLGKPLSERYAPHHDITVNWTHVETARCKVLICRNPNVATSLSFRKIASNIHADTAYIVKNNSSRRATGRVIVKSGV